MMWRPAIAGCLLLTWAWNANAQVAITAETHSAAVKNGRLVQDVGIETLGGVFTPLLHRGSETPCETTEIFTTAMDDQREIQIRLFRGVARLVRAAQLLGRFTILDLPPGPRGTTNVVVTVAARSDGSIVVVAKEKAGRPLRIERNTPNCVGPDCRPAKGR